MRSRMAEQETRSTSLIRTIAAPAALVLLASACSTGISASEPRGEDEVDVPQGDNQPGVPAAAFAPAPAGRFARLTHGQWENTVRDLLRLDEGAPQESAGP